MRYYFPPIALVFLVLMACRAQSDGETSPTPIRIGWQTTWATQGQIAQTLRHTNALTKNGLTGEFVGVSYGAPLNEAALAGNVDVIFTADQPAVTLLATGAKWEIIGRLMFNRVALYVPPESPIETVADLKGKTIAMPFGAAAQRVALKAITDAGIDPATDINAVNLDITEQAGVVARGTTSDWGEIDAMAGFDPTVAVLELSGKARILYVGQVTSVIVMSQEYISRYPQAPEQFLKAFQEAVLYYALHPADANKWFLEAAQLSFDEDVLALAASVEPNLGAHSIADVDMTLGRELISGMQEAADFIFEAELVDRQIDVSRHINLDYLERVRLSFSQNPYDPSDVYPLKDME